MIAIKEIKDVIAGEVTIKLPDNFPTKRVEVIILPVEENDGEKARSLSDFLLTGPTFSEEELQRLAQVREWMSQWDVKEF